MTWNDYINKIKNGPISTLLNPLMPEDCDDHGKFLAFFPKERENPPTWGYLSLQYILNNDHTLKRKEGEHGHYPLHKICSHWLPCPPNP